MDFSQKQRLETHLVWMEEDLGVASIHTNEKLDEIWN